MGIISDIEALLNPVVEQKKMELVDLQFTSEHGKKVLRVFLDKEGGFSLSDCEKMSMALGDLLDEKDVIKGAYALEISSPGLDRVLKKEKDFVRFAGKKAKINVFAPINGQRNFLGNIISCGSGKVKIEDVTGKTVEIPLDNMAIARLEPEL
jgi:ribosome maturation factor RimP